MSVLERSSRRSWNSRTIYVSGPMSGKPDMNRPAFAKATAELRKAGWRVVSPVELDEFKPDYVLANGEWSGHLRWDLAAMLLRCNFIVCLPGWKSSKGAMLENNVAKAVGIRRLTMDEALRGPEKKVSLYESRAGAGAPA